MALLLDPKRPDQVAEESPFAGALGVGAGQLDLGQIRSATTDSDKEAIASEDHEMSDQDKDARSDAEDEGESISKEIDPTEEQLPDAPYRPLE